MSTTKEQEREALKKIRKIVEGLGEGSYIGIAFEGCFEIAEENIENDFGCSMKQRVDKAKKEAEYFYETAQALSQKEKALHEENGLLKRKIFTSEELAAIKEIFVYVKREDIKTLNSLAEKIVEFADKPTSQEFGQAVLEHRRTSKRLAECEAFIGRVNEMM